MAVATGIAVIFDGLASRTYNFDALDSVSSSALGTTSASTWTKGAGTSGTITWDGDDISMTKGTEGSITVNYLIVGEGASIGSNLIANIPHTGVTLTEGDTIVYTSIQISFTTPDL